MGINLSRRGLLRRLGLLSAAAALTPVAPAKGEEPERPIPPERWALVAHVLKRARERAARALDTLELPEVAAFEGWSERRQRHLADGQHVGWCACLPPVLVERLEERAGRRGARFLARQLERLLGRGRPGARVEEAGEDEELEGFLAFEFELTTRQERRLAALALERSMPRELVLALSVRAALDDRSGRGEV